MNTLIGDPKKVRACASQPWAQAIVQTIQNEVSQMDFLDGTDLEDWSTADRVPAWAWDGRADNAEIIGANREVFAVAMGHVIRGFRFRKDLLTIATALALSPDDDHLKTIALRYWRAPLNWQRWQYPGYTQFFKEAFMAADGDGEWLATGDYMWAEVIGADLLAEVLPEADILLLRRRVAEHCARVEDDFYTQRSWFFGGYFPFLGDEQGVYPQGNQFTTVIGALCLGALMLRGSDPRADRWLELGVSQMLRSMDCTGTDGSYFEGSGYGLFTMERVILLAHILANNGDTRLLDHPQIVNFPYWLMDTTVTDNDRWLPLNDGGGKDTFSSDPLGVRNQAARVLEIALARSEDPALSWYLHEVLGGPSQDLFGLLCYQPGIPAAAPRADAGLLRMQPSQGWLDSIPDGAAIPAGSLTSARGEQRRCVHYPQQGIVIYRTGFTTSSQMVVLKGGWAPLGHDHYDRNSLLFFDGTSPIISEAGSGPYSDPEYEANFTDQPMHSTLNLDAQRFSFKQYQHMHSHEGVEELPDGRLQLVGEAARSYPELRSFKRTIQLHLPEAVQITDEVLPAGSDSHQAAFYFHANAAAVLLGDQVIIPGDSGDWILRVTKGDLTWRSVPLRGENAGQRTAFAAVGELPPQGEKYIFTLTRQDHKP